MENIINALDAIIEDVTAGAEADAIVADLEELKALIAEQDEGDKDTKKPNDKKPNESAVRKAMGLQPKE